MEVHRGVKRRRNERKTQVEGVLRKTGSRRG